MIYLVLIFFIFHVEKEIRKNVSQKNYDSEFEIEWNPFIMVSFTTCALENRTKLLYKPFCLTFIKCLPHGISKCG